MNTRFWIADYQRAENKLSDKWTIPNSPCMYGNQEQNSCMHELRMSLELFICTFALEN